MTQINLIQDTVMILDEVNKMDDEKEQLITYNLKQIEKQLEILDELERGTSIAASRVDDLSFKIKAIESSRTQVPKPVRVAKQLDNKLSKLEDMEQSMNDAIKKTEKMSTTVSIRLKKPTVQSDTVVSEEVLVQSVKADSSMQLCDNLQAENQKQKCFAYIVGAASVG